MSQPTSRATFKEYCLRQLGAPVLEINVADEQVDDIIDDAVQYFNERHFDGVAQLFMKYEITQEDIDRGTAYKTATSTNTAGIVTTTADATIAGVATSFNWYENSNYIEVPPEIIGVTKVMHFDGMDTATNTYLEDIQFALTTEKQIRFNQRQDRLYLDIDWNSLNKGDFIIMDCYRLLNPNDYTRVWNDSFLKPYATALIKRQWGQNLLKFQGVKLPGGIELNGRQIYDDAEKDLEKIREKMSNTWELPPLDMIG